MNLLDRVEVELFEIDVRRNSPVTPGDVEIVQI
jgi:hypothetical protein